MMRCPWCHAVPVGLTWPSLLDCEREHRRALYDDQQYLFHKERVMVDGPKAVRDRALVRAIDRTAR